MIVIGISREDGSKSVYELLSCMFTGFTVSYTKQILNAWMGFAIYGPGYIKDIQDQKQSLR